MGGLEHCSSLMASAWPGLGYCGNWRMNHWLEDVCSYYVCPCVSICQLPFTTFQVVKIGKKKKMAASLGASWTPGQRLYLMQRWKSTKAKACTTDGARDLISCLTTYIISKFNEGPEFTVPGHPRVQHKPLKPIISYIRSALCGRDSSISWDYRRFNQEMKSVTKKISQS